MNRYPDNYFIINGHTDNTGDEEHNLELSRERADSVYNYLLEQFDLSVENFIVDGFGSEYPADDNETERGRRKNRRVEIIIEK